MQLADLWPIMEEQINSGKSVSFKPRGTSMLPLLRQGRDTIVLSKAPKKLNKYDLPLYRRDDGHFVLHRIVGKKDGCYICCGDNQFEREFGIREDQILALAIGMYRDDKFISFDEKKYKFYSRRQVLKNSLYGFYIKLIRIGVKIKHFLFKKKSKK